MSCGWWQRQQGNGARNGRFDYLRQYGSEVAVCGSLWQWQRGECDVEVYVAVAACKAAIEKILLGKLIVSSSLF